MTPQKPRGVRLMLVRCGEGMPDWYTIERAKHDGREWLESMGQNAHRWMRSARISDADIEGSAAEMLAIAKAIRERGAAHFKRCAVVMTPRRAKFWSPRNSRRPGVVSHAAADELAAQIELELTAMTHPQPETPQESRPLETILQIVLEQERKMTPAQRERARRKVAAVADKCRAATARRMVEQAVEEAAGQFARMHDCGCPGGVDDKDILRSLAATVERVTLAKCLEVVRTSHCCGVINEGDATRRLIVRQIRSLLPQEDK